MTAKWEKSEGNSGVLTIEIESGRVDSALDEAFKKVVKKVNIPGFRKGKVPRKIFEQRVGVEALYEDALDILIPEAYTKAIEETGIEPVDRPDIDINQVFSELEKGKDLVIKATVTVKPEVKLGEYKGLEVEEDDVTVTEEDVDAELKQLQERHADLVVVEDGEVATGDTVVMDFEGFVDGEAFEGGKAENYSLEIGSGQFIPGFEDQLVGTKAGEEKEINVEFPAEYHSEELAGKPAVFKVTVHDIKRKELPELDDEFAKDVNEEVETLDQLKADLREKLETSRKQQADAKKRDALVAKAAENAEVDLPEAMIATETDHMLRELGQNLQAQGMSLDMYYQFAQTDEEGMKAQFHDDAEKRVRQRLTLEAISEAENFEVTDEDVDQEINEMAETYKRSAEEIKQILAMQGGVDTLKNELKIKKALDFLVEESKSTATE